MQDSQKSDSDKEEDKSETTTEITKEQSGQSKMSLQHPDFLKPQKLDGETNYQYKVRRWMQKAYIKQRSKGTFMWIAKDTKLPVYSDEDTELMKTMTQEEKAKVKPIAYKISKGFSYDKIKVQIAMDKYFKEKDSLTKSTKVDIITTTKTII